jgi:hypothetical protein
VLEFQAADDEEMGGDPPVEDEVIESEGEDEDEDIDQDDEEEIGDEDDLVEIRYDEAEGKEHSSSEEL